MHPRLLTTPFFTVPTFGVLLATAYLAALVWLMRGARREGIDAAAMISVGIWAIIGAILGAKVLMIVRSWHEYAATPSQLWSLSLLRAGGDFYGGFLGGVVAAALAFRRNLQLPFWRSADLCAPAIALGQAIGRIGCFMAGDDYGRTTSVPWAVTFTDRDAALIGGAPLHVPLHPVQIYESFMCLAFFFFLVWLGRRKRFDGQIILVYTMLYAIGRFGLEYFRGDADRGFVFDGALSTSQFIGIIMFVVSLILFTVRHHSSSIATAESK